MCQCVYGFSLFLAMFARKVPVSINICVCVYLSPPLASLSRYVSVIWQVSNIVAGIWISKGTSKIARREFLYVSIVWDNLWMELHMKKGFR